MGIDGETVEIVSDFIFLGSKITADGDCSHEIKRRLLLGRKEFSIVTYLQSVFASLLMFRKTSNAKARTVTREGVAAELDKVVPSSST